MPISAELEAAVLQASAAHDALEDARAELNRRADAVVARREEAEAARTAFREAETDLSNARTQVGAAVQGLENTLEQVRRLLGTRGGQGVG